MVKFNSKFIIAIPLILTIWILKSYVFVNDQVLIKRTLQRVATQASFTKKTIHPFEQIKKAKELANNFADQTEITLKTPSGEKEKIYNHEQLIKFATLTRSYLDSLDVDFKDQQITINDKIAEVNLTAVAKITEKSSSSSENFAQELIIKLKKVGTEWVIQSAENVEFLEK